jgi:hypothetical protein
LAERLSKLVTDVATPLGREDSVSMQAGLEELSRIHQRDFDRFFRTPADPTQLLGQDNFLRYVPVRLWVWARPDDERWQELLEVVVASFVTGSELRVVVEGRPSAAWQALGRHVPLVAVEDSTAFAAALAREVPDRLLVLGAVPERVRGAAEEAHVQLTARTPLPSGRVEVLLHLREQSVCVNTHRYGHLGLNEVLRERAA